MKTIIENIIAAINDNDAHALELALKAAGIDATLKMRRTTEEHIEVPAYGLIVLDDKHGGWWVRGLQNYDLKSYDSGIENEDLADDMIKLAEYAQAVA